MKILLTGAHFTPAVSVIGEFKKRGGVKIVYVGRKTTMENDNTPSVESIVLPGLGVKFIPITTGRLQRYFSIHAIISLLKIPVGFIQAFFILLREKPDIVLSFGGYVGLPLVICGWLFSIPIIIHEQSLISGLANQISSVFAQKIALSFNYENKEIRGKYILTGNPLRNEVVSPLTQIGRDYMSIFNTAKGSRMPVILVMGGNQGSHSINIVVGGSLEKIKKIARVIHITGNNKFNDFERLRNLQDEKYLVKKWIGDEIGTIYSKVDFVISRAGVNTLTELAFYSKPSLVIPLQTRFQIEQMVNARYFEKLGLVRVLEQKNLSERNLIENIKWMIKNLEKMKKSAGGAEGVVISDVAERLVLETLLLANENSK